MKKITLILLALVLVFSLMSCSDKEELTPTEQLITDFITDINTGKLRLDLTPIVEKDDTPMTELFDLPYQYDLSPYITLKKQDYKGITLTLTPPSMNSVTADALIASVEQDLVVHGTVVEVTDRGAKIGDKVNFDFKGTLNGVAFEGGSAEKVDVELGNGGYIPGFEDNLVGHKAGEEFSFDITFPDDYTGADLAGKKVNFEIKINSISYTVPRELNDEYAKEVYGCNSVRDYLIQMYVKLYESITTSLNNQFRTAALNQVRSNVNMTELPLVEYENYFNYYVGTYEKAAEERGLTLNEYISETLGKTIEEFSEIANDKTKEVIIQELLVFAIANEENLYDSITKTDYNEYLLKVSKEYDMTPEEFENTYETQYIWKSVVLEKVIDLIIDNAKNN